MSIVEPSTLASMSSRSGLFLTKAETISPAVTFSLGCSTRSLVPKNASSERQDPSTANISPEIKNPLVLPIPERSTGTSTVGSMPPTVQNILAVDINLVRSLSSGETTALMPQNGTSCIVKHMPHIR